MPFHIRPATHADVESLVAFNAAMALETENKRLDRGTLERGVVGLIENPSRGKYLMACDDGDRIVGQLMHTFEWSDWRNGDVWWIQSVYVLPEFRRRGVFKALYAAVRGLARMANGVVGLRLYVEVQNRNAQETYLAMGMNFPGYTVMEEMFSGHPKEHDR